MRHRAVRGVRGIAHHQMQRKLPHTAGLYGKVSRQMFDLCETLTPLVQRNSIDEGYLDLGPCGLVTRTEVEARVRGLQARIWDELQVPVSFGLATNKLVAQIASKLRKPRGFVIVPPGTEAAFLAPLAVGKLPGIGAKTEATLVGAHGIRIVSDLLVRSERELETIFGRGWREILAMARGEDERPVETEHDEARSYSQQETVGRDVGARLATDSTPPIGHLATARPRDGDAGNEIRERQLRCQ